MTLAGETIRTRITSPGTTHQVAGVIIRIIPKILNRNPNQAGETTPTIITTNPGTIILVAGETIRPRITTHSLTMILAGEAIRTQITTISLTIIPAGETLRTTNGISSLATIILVGQKTPAITIITVAMTTRGAVLWNKLHGKEDLILHVWHL